MSFGNGFRGVVGGSVQAAVTDQPGVAVPGMLAFASDLNYHDAVYIGEADGLAAGIAGMLAAVSDDISLQRPNVQMSALAGTETEGDFEADGAILIFDEAMQSDENGDAGWANGRVGRVVRMGGRSGARIYVRVNDAVAPGDPVELCSVAGTNPVYTVGQFGATVRDGSTTLPTTLTVTGARWVTSAAAGEVAILEFL